jgi:tryptophanyl-tRNA synthetase
MSMEFIVTPWEVRGFVDYDKLVKEFGTQPLTNEILEKVRKLAGELHIHLRRRIFFSHRDFDWILNKYEAGEKFILYTGRGPSGHTHLGHLLPWFFTRWLQEKFNVKLIFQMTNDEKFLYRYDLSIEDALKFSYENSLDLIALGFEPERTVIFINTLASKTLYNIAIKVAKHVTTSTVKAIFGFEDSTNIGMIFFPAIQAAPCFVESVLQGRNIPCLIPAAIDQDPYWRMTRDVAPKIGFYKPAQVHCKFLPGLGVGGKMSSSMPETCIFTIDDPDEAYRKVMNAFTGGRPTREEQHKLGGNPDICTVFQYEYYLFENDDDRVKELELMCRNGQLLCGDCKMELASKVRLFLKEHQRRREAARNIVDRYLYVD